MFTLIPFAPIVIPKVRTGLFLLLTLSNPQLWALAAPVQEQQQNTQHLSCSVGYAGEECVEHLARLRTVLIQFSTSRLGHWNWILVSSEEWMPLLRRLRLDNRSIAFSSLEQRTIVLQEALFQSRGEAAVRLARNLKVPVDQLLPMAVSHELGHILCRDADEAAANRVGEQLRNGKTAECGGSRRSLTRMEELMYQQSRGLGQPFRH
jgi:hypothetical protein